MLSKNNKILIGCLALLLVMSVGYALFSDTITINGTATAKGDFDITSDCFTGVVDGVNGWTQLSGGGWQTIREEKGYQKDTCSVLDDTVSLNAEFLYPGAKRYFTTKFTNTGSIDAKLLTENVTFKDVNSCVDLDGDGSFSDNECGVLTELLRGFGVAAVQIGEGSIIPFNEMTSEVANEFLDTQRNLILKPGNSMYAVFEMGVSEDYGDNKPGNMMLSMDFTVELPFEQITN